MICIIGEVFLGGIYYNGSQLTIGRFLNVFSWVSFVLRTFRHNGFWTAFCEQSWQTENVLLDVLEIFSKHFIKRLETISRTLEKNVLRTVFVKFI